MAIRALATIKSWFQKNDYPTESQFNDTWDSFWHKLESIPQSYINGLAEALGLKASNEYVDNSLALKQNKALAQGKIWQGNVSGEAVEVDMPAPGGISATPLDVFADLASYVDPANGQLFVVEDASGDPTVTSGAALYHYRESDTSFRKLAEYESLDILMQALSISFDPTGTTMVSTNVEAAIKELDGKKLDNALSLGKIWVGGADGKVSEQPFPNLSVIDNLVSTETGQALSANQGRILKGLVDAINTLLTSDDTTLDELQEIVDYVKLNRSDLDALGISSIAGLQAALDDRLTDSPVDGNQYVRQNGAWVENTDSTVFVDNLLSTEAGQALSANQGRVLKGFIDAINTLLTSDDTTLDELQEIVNYIKLNRSDLDALNVASIIGLQAALDLKLEDAPSDNNSYVRNNGAWVKEGSVVESANITIYVETTGSDETGDGTSVGTAFATLGKALLSIGQNLNNNAVTINLGAGSFDITPNDAFILNQFKNSRACYINIIGKMSSVTSGFSISSNSVKEGEHGVTGASFVASEHKGRFLYDSQQWEISPIADNTENSILCRDNYMRTEISELTTTVNLTGVLFLNLSVRLNFTYIKFNFTTNIRLESGRLFIAGCSFIGSGILLVYGGNIRIRTSYIESSNSIRFLAIYQSTYGYEHINAHIEGCVFSGTVPSPIRIAGNCNLEGILGNYFYGVDSCIGIDDGLSTLLIRDKMFVNTCSNIIDNDSQDYSGVVNRLVSMDSVALFSNAIDGDSNIKFIIKDTGGDGIITVSSSDYFNPQNIKNIYVKGVTFPEEEFSLNASLSNGTTTLINVGDITQNRSIIIDYLVERNTLFEEGQIRILYNGSTLQFLQPTDLKQDNNSGSGIGVTFTIDFDSVDTNLINIEATLDSGDDATLKYNAKRKMI